MNTLTLLYRQFGKWLFPVYCLRCGREDDWVCQMCESSDPSAPIQRCIFCKAIEKNGATCGACRRRHHLDGLVVRGIYGQWVWRSLIHAWKYRGAKDAGIFCGRYIAECLDLMPMIESMAVVPVPLAPARKRERGFNQAEFLGLVLASSLNIPLIRALRRTRETMPQSKLSSEDRLKNVSDCFTIVPACDVRGQSFILVDDIVTTGATLDAAAKELKRAGAAQVWGLALVRGELSIK